MNIRVLWLLGLWFCVGPLQADDKIIFTDDFESGAEKWEPLNQEKKQTWRIEASDKGQSFYQFAQAGKYPGKHRAPKNLSLLKDIRVTDFTFEADVKKFKKGGHQDVCLRLDSRTATTSITSTSAARSTGHQAAFLK